ncbi:hypothetical protein [Noviherbaspirillum galbum]|nr:hypothetical protein [Noviherbaspirillum galbum]
MTSLAIKDIATATDLDSADMTTVRGGTCSYPMPSLPSCYGMPSLSAKSSDFNFNATQSLGQSQNTEVNNGNNVAFACGITSNVNPTQCGSNNISIGH